MGFEPLGLLLPLQWKEKLRKESHLSVLLPLLKMERFNSVRVGICGVWTFGVVIAFAGERKTKKRKSSN